MKTLSDLLIVSAGLIAIGVLTFTVGALPFLVVAAQLVNVFKFNF